MRKRLFIFGNALIVLMVVLISVISYYNLKTNYITQTKTNLRVAVGFFADHLQHGQSADDSRNTLTGAENLDDLISQTKQIFSSPNIVNFRVTLLDADGKVMKDSDYPVSELNNHRSREEVYAIIRGNDSASSIRHSSTQNEDVLYYAEPLWDGIIRVSSSLSSLYFIKLNIFKIASLGGVLNLLIYNLGVFFLYKKQQSTLDSYQEVFDKLQQGKLDARMPEDRYTTKDLLQFAQTFNPALDTVENQVRVLTQDRYWLSRLVHALKEPLVVVNRDLEVVFANQFARDLFNRNIDPITHPYPFVLLTHEEKLDDMCLSVLDSGEVAKNVSLIFDDEPVFMPVKANRDRIKQIFINLLDNAIKYNRDFGKVWVKLERQGEFVLIEVKDNGFGFSNEHSKRVFERFYRVDKSRSKELGGTGLGLSIVKHIALLYDGEVSVDSKPGVGSTFRVKLKT